MIADNPLGVGPGNWEWGYTPWFKAWRRDPDVHSKSVVRSPHNAYLELLAEYGLPAGICILTALGIFLWRSRRYSYLMAFSAYILTDALFNFPMELAVTIYAFALALGFYSRSYSNETHRHMELGRSAIRIIFAIPLIFSFIWTTRYSLGEFYETEKTYKGYALACKINPSDWQACINKGVNEIMYSRFGRAERTLKGILKERPYHHLANGFLIHSLKKQGKEKEAAQMEQYYKNYMRTDKVWSYEIKAPKGFEKFKKQLEVKNDRGRNSKKGPARSKQNRSKAIQK